MAKRKRINNDLQNSAQKTKNGALRTLQKTVSELRCYRRVDIQQKTVYHGTISHETVIQ